MIQHAAYVHRSNKQQQHQREREMYNVHHATEWKNKNRISKNLLRFFLCRSVIFWFQCTHELEHIQISCLFLAVYFFL